MEVLPIWPPKGPDISNGGMNNCQGSCWRKCCSWTRTLPSFSFFRVLIVIYLFCIPVLKVPWTAEGNTVPIDWRKLGPLGRVTFPEFVMKANERAKIRITQFLPASSPAPTGEGAALYSFLFGLPGAQPLPVPLSDLPKAGTFIPVLSPSGSRASATFRCPRKSRLVTPGNRGMGPVGNRESAEERRTI